MPTLWIMVEFCKRPFNHHYQSDQSGLKLSLHPLTVRDSRLFTLLFRILRVFEGLLADRRPVYSAHKSRLFHISSNPVTNSATWALGIPHCWITASFCWRERTFSFFLGNPKHQPKVYGNRWWDLPWTNLNLHLSGWRGNRTSYEQSFENLSILLCLKQVELLHLYS